MSATAQIRQLGQRVFGTSGNQSINSVAPTRSHFADYDYALISVIAVLLMFSLVMVYSASIALPDSRKFAAYSPLHFFIRQMIAICIGLMAAYVAFQIPMAVWQKYAPWLFLLAIALLIIVLIPGVGKGVNGSKRWIPLPVFSFQPSELMKLAAVLYAADYTVRKQSWMHDFKKGFLPMALAMALVGALLLLEPDLGAFVVIVCIAMGLLFIGGVNARLFGGLVATLAVTFAALIWFSPWRRERIFAYLNPWQEDNALGKAYQLSHSLIAFGRGEWTGVGLGASVEKLHYLPEAHTDFLLAVVGEELGFVGVLFVIGMFFFLVMRAFSIGRQAIKLERTYAGLVAMGVGIWFGVQAFFNMGVNLGLLPTKGLTLPLLSYGGSGVIMNLIMLAILLRVDAETRQMMTAGRRI